MGSFLSQKTNEYNDIEQPKHVEWSVYKEKVLLMGYLRHICKHQLINIPNDVFQILLLYYHVKVLYIISHNNKINIIDKKQEQNIQYNNENTCRRTYRRDVLYQRKLGTINYNLIPYYLKKSLLEQIKPLQNKNTNFRNNIKFIQPHIKNENDANNLQIQDLIDPYNNIHTAKYGQIHWIPTIFEKQKGTNHFKIASEINDLPLNTKHNDLYQTIENIFNEFLPSFNDIMYDKLTIEKKKQFNSTKQNENIKICENIYNEDRLFVVIKMQDYIFNGSCEYEPNWHKEGYDKEYIEAVGIYYFDIINDKYFQCNELELRCITGLEDKANGCGKYWRKFDNKNIEISNDMCVIFKNNPLFMRFLIDGNENAVLHRAHLKVDAIVNEKVSRKILTFFVIDPVKGNDKWYKDETIRVVFDKVNSEKISKVEYDNNRESKNSPQNAMYSMKPPSWIGDDPLTRIVYAGMGD
eukprot:510256_1